MAYSSDNIIVDGGITGNTANFSIISLSGSDITTIFYNSGSNPSPDNYVTGGTYNNGTLTLNRQNGSVIISGLLTGTTGTFVTGFTYNNAGLLTINQNNQPPLFTTINNFTGLTVSGSLSATTISGNSIYSTTLISTSNTQRGIVYTDMNGLLTIDTRDLIWDDTNKRVGINQQGLTPSATLDIHSSVIGLPITQFNQTFSGQSITGGSIVQITFDPSTGITSGSRIGSFQWASTYDGTHTFNRGASIAAFATENWTSTANGTRLIFNVVSGGTTTRVNALTINQDTSVSLSNKLTTPIISAATYQNLPSRATYQATPTDPTTTTSTTGVMMGLAGSITPILTGNIMIIISGDMDNATGDDGCTVQIRTGIGTAPGNGTVLTGTTRGGAVNMIMTASFGTTTSRTPFTCNCLITSLTLNTAIWIDLTLAAINGGTARIRNVSISAIEI